VSILHEDVVNCKIDMNYHKMRVLSFHSKGDNYLLWLVGYWLYSKKEAESLQFGEA